MQVHRLRLVNFRQHEATEIRFGEGLTGIIGPNGSGKSTLLEAMAWAMYGTKAARGTAASLRRRNAPPRARVEVETEFSLGAHRYRVCRTLHGAELYQDLEETPIANSPSAVTELLTRILGMTREEFFNTYFTGQKELTILGAMTAGERAQFLSRVLGYERLKSAQEKLKTDRNLARAQLQQIQSRLPSPAQLAEEDATVTRQVGGAEQALVAAQSALRTAEEELATRRPEWERLEAVHERVRSLESDLRVCEQRVTNARDTHRSLDRDLVEALSAQARIEELTPSVVAYADLLSERVQLDAQAEQMARWREHTGQLGEVKLQLEAIESRLNRLPSTETAERFRAELAEVREGFQTAEEKTQDAQTEWVRDQQDANTKLKQITDQYQDIRTQRDTLTEAGPDGVCPTCGQPLGTTYAEVLDGLTRQAEDLTLNGKFYRSRIKQLTAEPKRLVELRRERDGLRSRVTTLTEELGRLEGQVQEGVALERDREAMRSRRQDLETKLAQSVGTYDEARHHQVRAALAEIEPARQEIERLRAIAERAVRLTSAASAAEAELTAQEGALRALGTQLDEAGWSAESAQAVRTALDNAEAARLRADRVVIEADAELRVLVARRDEVERRRREREQDVTEAARIEQDLQLNQELDRAFSDLRSDLNDTMRPDLSELGSTFLRDLTTGRYTDFELDDDYNPTIIVEGEAQRVLSGGEEDIVSLALRLAVSQMIAERAGQPLSLLILDEIFGSLDEQRREAVVDLLRNLGDRFPQVILITHIEAVREGFDRVIRLEYDVEHGVARVREENGQDVAA
jgi:exonuclease SbcC